MQIEIGSLVKTKRAHHYQGMNLPTGFGVVTKCANIKHRSSKIVYVFWMDGEHTKPRPINQVYLEVINEVQ
jgi:hypothetical protein